MVKSNVDRIICWDEVSLQILFCVVIWNKVRTYLYSICSRYKLGNFGCETCRIQSEVPSYSIMVNYIIKINLKNVLILSLKVHWQYIFNDVDRKEKALPSCRMSFNSQVSYEIEHRWRGKSWPNLCDSLLDRDAINQLFSRWSLPIPLKVFEISYALSRSSLNKDHRS